MKLTGRQRAKVNASLALIYDTGHDVSAVTGMAAAYMRTGTSVRMAYESALNKFIERTPSLLAPLQRITRLIEASDHKTLAQYNVALSKYIDTGDDSSLRALAPMIASDMTELAARTGEVAPDFSPEMDSLLAGEGASQQVSPAAPAQSISAPQNTRGPGHGPPGYRPSEAAAARSAAARPATPSDA